jgi:mono/diheme cytochrome c family protein
MLKRIMFGTGVMMALSLTGFTATAQQDVGQAGELFEKGREIYGSYCVQCHRSTGEGIPPTFPALAGNENLADADLVVGNIFHGRGAMPAFPNLDAEQVAAVATYVRTNWDNEFGAVDAERVVAILGDQMEEMELVSVWSGIYTEEQAARGESLYMGACAMCHGRRLNGAPEDPDRRSTPPLARERLIRSWEGQSVASLFEYTKSTMPEANPGYMSDQDYLDIIAFMFQVTEMPTGEQELAPVSEDLSRIVIEYRPEDGG